MHKFVFLKEVEVAKGGLGFDFWGCDAGLKIISDFLGCYFIALLNDHEEAMGKGHSRHQYIHRSRRYLP